jgi:hypothetical protein
MLRDWFGEPDRDGLIHGWPRKEAKRTTGTITAVTISSNNRKQTRETTNGNHHKIP